MKILAIETSCDETAATVLEGSGDTSNATFKILGNALLSQADLHAAYGGVYPNLAKREHQLNLVPLTIKALTEAGLYKEEEERR
jgi:N6-L-threonylcarbamoyladenine synthase